MKTCASLSVPTPSTRRGLASRIFPLNLLFPSKPVSAAIVLTVRNAERLLPSFLSYHLAIGFSRIFLFFDAADDPGIRLAEGIRGVTITVRDGQLERSWRSTRVYHFDSRVREQIEKEAMARQMLNAELGLRMALEQGITWLLHIDVDELFYCPAGTVHEHFRAFTEAGHKHVKYLNHEAVPESIDIDNCFHEATLFKRNPGWGNAGPETPGDRKCPKPCCFQFYVNGKSAAKVTKSVVPVGVHDFRSYRRTPWLRSKSSVFSPQDGTVILHYPCCGFESFWTKFVTRGYFPDKWWGTGGAQSEFNRVSRDVVATGDRAAARRCYEEWMVLGDSSLAAMQLQENRFIRITYPSELLRKVDRRQIGRS